MRGTIAARYGVDSRCPHERGFWGESKLTVRPREQASPLGVLALVMRPGALVLRRPAHGVGNLKLEGGVQRQVRAA